MYSDFVTAPDAQGCKILAEVGEERIAQDEEWGEQNHPDGTGPNIPLLGWPKLPSYSDVAYNARIITKEKDKRGIVTWADILLEEVFEAVELTDVAKLREELIQIAAVATAWTEAIDRRTDLGKAAYEVLLQRDARERHGD